MTIFNKSHTTNFLLIIPNSGLTAAFEMGVQQALIPGVRIPVTDAPTGTQGIGRAALPGSTMEFDPLIIRFIVDENLDSHTQIYSWMVSLNNYLTLRSEGWKKGALPEFVTLHVLDNHKEKIVCSYHYYGAWPSELGEVEYNYSDDGNPPVTSTATFHYKYVEIEKDGKIIRSHGNRDDVLFQREKQFGVHPSFR